jgi:hypothetical protein
VANGTDKYDFSLLLRDTYGNEVKDGDIYLEYKDALRTIQVDTLSYQNVSDYCASGTCAIITG